MDKFKYIRVKQSSGEYGTSIPIAVDWNNIDNNPITVDSNGIIDIANIPKAALERLTIVADDTARFALTTATVQTGDTVKVTSTGRMYYVIDDTKLNVEAGYTEYSAGTAASVPWSGVTSKPTTASGYGITDVYTKSQTDTALGDKVDKVNGKDLSTNDYTTEEKNKLDGIAAGAEVNVNPDWNATSGDAAILNKPTTISGYGITDAYTKTQTNNLLNNKVDKISGKGLSTNDYTTTEKNKLAGIAAGAEVNVNPDWNATSGDAAILNKPTTVDGYGITDAYTKTDVDNFVDTDVVTSEAANPLVIETAAAQTAKSTIVNIEPIQDLHGYDHPWPAGGGKNLLDESLLGSGSTKYNAIYVGDGTFTLSTTAPKNNNNSANLFFLAGNVSSGIGTDANGVWNGNPRTVQSQNGYVTVCDRTVDGIDISDYKTLLEKGSAVTAYEPYSNICPISGLDEVKVERTGKNLAISGYPWNVDASGSILYSELYNSCIVRVKKDKTYIHSINDSAAITPVIAFYTNYPELNSVSYNASRMVSGASTFTAPIDGYAVIRHDASDTNIQVELGSTATAYEPYQKFATEVDLPATVYGGTLDLETGELVCDKGIVDLGDLTWVAFTGWGSDHTYQSSEVSAMIHNGEAWTKDDIGSSSYEVFSHADRASVYGGTASFGATIRTDTPRVVVADSRYINDVSGFSNAVNGSFVYPLATPITYHLTPSQLDLLKGTNVLTVNGKTIQVTYREGSLATLEEVNEVSDALTSEERTSEEGNSVTIETDAAQYAKKTHLTLDLVQDLHGYDHPWAGGAGKNLLPMTVDGIKTNPQNVNISWNGNVGTAYGATITLHTNDGVSVSKISISGTSTNTIYFCVGSFNLKSGVSYVLNGCPSSPPSNGVLYVSGQPSGFGSWVDSGSGATYNATQDWDGILFYIRIWKDIAQNNDWYPMIRLASVSDATFEPYSNICPITPMGHRNLLAPQSIADPFVSNGITFIVNSDGSVTVNGTASSNTWLLIGTAHLTAGEKYVLTGGVDAGRMMQLTDYPVVNSKGFDNGSSGLMFTAEANVVYGVRAYIASGVTVNNETLYPMIRPASDLDSTFVPYGMARVGAKVTGFNIWDEEWVLGSLNTSNGTNIPASNRIRSLDYIQVSPSTTYYIKSPYQLIACSYDADKTYVKTQWINNQTLLTDENVHYIKIASNTDATTYNNDICVNISDSSRNGTYEPYTEYTASLDLPEPVYSGTLDLETGEVVADMGIIRATTASKITSSYFAIPLPNAKYLTDRYSYTFITDRFKNMANASAPNAYIEANQQVLVMRNGNTYSTSAEFMQAIGGEVNVAYELAMPKTYQLTPQQLALFKGINNISTNAKTVQVTYRNGELATTGDIVASTEVAKQNAIGESASYTDARLATELAPILGNFATAETSPAIASHAVGEYLLYNNRLYKVLAAISAGQQLTIGTNIGQTNVAAELASLNNIITVMKSDIVAPNAGAHNGIYRGKDITSYLTDGSLWNRIKGNSGYSLFDDLYLGDYITVSSNSYAIVDFDYYLRCGSVNITEHHVVMMPTGNMNIPEGTALYGVSGQTLQFINTANAGVTVSSQESATGFKWNAKMSDPNTHSTNGGYKYSRMRRVIMKAANTIVINVFGSSHVKPITVLYPNPSSETASGIASGWAWFVNDDQSAADAKSLCDLPNETQIYGQQVWGRGTVYTNMGYEVGTDKFQFAICALQRNFVDTRANWWLRSVYSASLAAYVDAGGDASNYGTANAFGVRPRFLLVG